MRFWPGGQTPQNSQTPGPEVPAHPFRTCPVGQDSQLSHAVLTPAAALNFPASQLVQTVEPTAAENFPASQLVQAAELVCAVKNEKYPASQLVN